HFTSIAQDLSNPIALKTGSELINLSQNEVVFNAEVAQFTEGETEVRIGTKGMPINRKVTFSPSSITIKYKVPIEEYQKVSDLKIFDVYITYQQILEDSTGFITPKID